MIFEPRASAILYNILKSNDTDKIYIIPSNVCPIVPITFLKADRKFELIDINDDTLCLDEEVVLKKLKYSPNKYAGVLFVRTYGTDKCFEPFFKRIKEISGKHLVIDDRCLSVPNYKYVDTYADVILYSTGYSKIVDLGYGGFAQIKETINYRKYQTIYSKDSHIELTNNYKQRIEARSPYIYKDSDWLDNSNIDRTFENHVLLIQEEQSKSTEIKKKINKIYSDNLPHNAQLDPDFQLWRFNIRVPNKNTILKYLFANDLFASSHFASLKGIFSEGVAANAEKLHSTVINLFNDKYYSEEKAYKTVEIINEHINNKKF